MKTLTLEFKRDPQRSEIFFGRDLFPAIPEFVNTHFAGRPAAVISDATVGDLYGGKMLAAFKAQGLAAQLIMFPAGEASKCREVKGALEDELFRRGFGRDCLVIALGGGVTGDLAGFTASTFCRGVPVIQVPTTVLAMADSSVGGKTGIDVPAGKNLVGTFHQPRAVFMDPEVLATLPERDIRAGMVEVVKHGLIRDAALFDLLETHVDKLCKPVDNPALFNDILFRSCSIKGDVVRQDEVEGGLRQTLNFGHTAGHAVEALSDWSLLHGEAVALGILAALDISAETGDLQAADVKRAHAFFEALGTPMTWDFSIPDAMAVMQHDKKVRQKTVRFVLLDSIGQIRQGENWAMPVPADRVTRALQAIGGKL